jgi:hypothetical protein
MPLPMRSPMPRNIAGAMACAFVVAAFAPSLAAAATPPQPDAPPAASTPPAPSASPAASTPAAANASLAANAPPAPSASPASSTSPDASTPPAANAAPSSDGTGAAASAPTTGSLPARRATFDRGVSLGLFAEDPGWSYRPLLNEIAATGADHVELVVAWYQTDGAATEIGEHPRFSAPPSAVRAAIRDAHAAGLAVLLFPIVRLSAPRNGDWRGTLHPDDRAAWWRSYGARLEALARLAAEEHVAMLSVGSELSTLDGPADHDAWAQLIARVRRRFGGPLIYSGNWDHFRDVALYDLVDRIGLCAYFALVDAGGAHTVDDLIRGWRDWRAELARFARTRGRPLTLTEVGYRSIAGVGASPWDEGTPGAIDLDEQRRCYEAFRRVWQGAPPDLLAGVYFWNWYGWGGPTSRSYSPRGKPAADELRQLFKR